MAFISFAHLSPVGTTTTRYDFPDQEAIEKAIATHDPGIAQEGAQYKNSASQIAAIFANQKDVGFSVSSNPDTLRCSHNFFNLTYFKDKDPAVGRINSAWAIALLHCGKERSEPK